MFLIGWIIQLIILPFFSNFNLLFVFLLPLFVFVLSGPMFLGAIIVFLFPVLDPIYMAIFERLINGIVHLNQLSIPLYLPKLGHLGIGLYFVTLIYVVYHASLKRIMASFLMLALVLFSRNVHFNLIPKVIFLDVGQGDSIYLEGPECNMMIDSFTGSLNFLKNRGIYHLDYLFLTHPDNDHIKESDAITKTLRVSRVMISPYGDYPSFNADIVTLYPHTTMTCGPFLIQSIGPLNAYDSDNNQSLVLKIHAYDRAFLFTGDMELAAEEDLIWHADLKSDVLKVAHHGSNTSTSTAFLNAVKPSEAIISVGKYNRYGFPSDDVLSRLDLEGVIVHRTDRDHTIIYAYHPLRRKWTVHLPFRDDF